MKIKHSIFAVLTILLFASCSFNDELYPDYENETFNPSPARLEKTGIPVVQLNTMDGETIESKEEWKDASFAILGNACGFEDLSIETLKVKGRGNSTWEQPKKPYSLKLEEKAEILGMPKSKRWVLIANYSDKTLMRNLYASYLANTIYKETWNPSFKSVHLILNGQYKGVYMLGEQIKIDDNRVNIKDISKAKSIDKGGFIFEIDGRQDEAFNFITGRGVCISLKDPDEVSDEIQQRVKDIIQTAEDALYSENFADPENGWRKYFDEASVIAWYLMNELGKNVDSANYASIYFYYDPSDKLIHMGPNWDFDLAYGNVNYADCDSTEDLYVKDNSIWIHQMFFDAGFVNNVKNKWNSTREPLYASINTWIPEEALSLQKAAYVNFSRWEILGKYVWPNPSGYYIRTTYQSEIDYLTDWLNDRYSYLNTSLNEL